MRELIDPDPHGDIGVISVTDIPDKGAEGGHDHRRHQADGKTVMEQVQPALDTEGVQDQEGQDDDQDQIGICQFIEDQVDRAGNDEHGPGDPSAAGLVPLIGGRIRVAVQAAGCEPEETDGAEGRINISQIFPHPVRVKGHGLPVDQAGPAAGYDQQKAGQAGPEHDPADLAEGNIPAGQDHQKKLQKVYAVCSHMFQLQQENAARSQQGQKADPVALLRQHDGCQEKEHDKISDAG